MSDFKAEPTLRNDYTMSEADVFLHDDHQCFTFDGWPQAISALASALVTPFRRSDAPVRSEDPTESSPDAY